MPLLVVGCITMLIAIIVVIKATQKTKYLAQQANEHQQAVIKYEAQEKSLSLKLENLQGLIQNQAETNKLLANDIAHAFEQKQALNEDIANAAANIEKLKSSFQTTEEEFKKKYLAERKLWLETRQTEYLQMQEDFVEQFREENKKKMTAAQELTNELAQLQSSVDAATAVAKRHAEEEDFNKFHSLQLSENARNDIQSIEEVLGRISKEANEAIAKVIWKVYYEKPYTDLIGRVVGAGRHTGIYKITNNLNQMCYVGQAVDIADRWRQHIKRALNAEPRTQNKLYPAMYKDGLENFTFEIIEECDISKLNEREDYWQTFYHAKEYGYSIK